MDPRELLTSLYHAAVRAVDPARLVHEALGRRGRALFIRSLSAGRREFVFAKKRVALLALGKAAVPMAAAANEALTDLVDDGLVIAPRQGPQHGLPDRYRLLHGSHPHPGEDSVAAAVAALTLAGSLGADDLLLVLLSGGGSALMAAPAEGLGLEDKSRTIALLMAAGAPIAEVNLVRGALSRVKAGRLAEAAGTADVVTLVLSDLGDAGWHLVASGPTLGVPPTPKEARELLARYRLLPLVPPAVKDLLDDYHAPPKPSPRSGQRWSVLLGDIRSALEGARQEALRLGADVRVMPELLHGEARAAARRLALAGACAGNLVRRPGSGGRRLVTVFGGETTVTVKGSGHGGRNRELALATATQIAGVPGAAVLVAGTDGIDNEPDAAGAFVDDATLARAEARGLDPTKALVDNDTGPFFATLGDAFVPGATGTNVGDVAFVLAPGEHAALPPLEAE